MFSKFMPYNPARKLSGTKIAVMMVSIFMVVFSSCELMEM